VPASSIKNQIRKCTQRRSDLELIAHLHLTCEAGLSFSSPPPPAAGFLAPPFFDIAAVDFLYFFYFISFLKKEK
jgi:hypothetical protein